MLKSKLKCNGVLADDGTEGRHLLVMSPGAPSVRSNNSLLILTSCETSDREHTAQHHLHLTLFKELTVKYKHKHKYIT